MRSFSDTIYTYYTVLIGYHLKINIKINYLIGLAIPSITFYLLQHNIGNKKLSKGVVASNAAK